MLPSVMVVRFPFLLAEREPQQCFLWCLSPSDNSHPNGSLSTSLSMALVLAFFWVGEGIFSPSAFPWVLVNF